MPDQLAAQLSADRPDSPGQFPEKYYQDPMGLDRYVVQEKLLHEWQAPNKIVRNFSRTERIQYLGVLMLIALILILLGELAGAVVITAAGVIGALYLFIPASPMKCEVTTIGVKIEDKYLFWNDLSQFWLEERFGKKVLYLRAVFPALQVWKITVLPADEEDLKKILGKYILFKVPSLMGWAKMLRTILRALPFELEGTPI